MRLNNYLTLSSLVFSLVAIAIAIATLADKTLRSSAPVTIARTVAFCNVKVPVLPGWITRTSESEITMSRGKHARVTLIALSDSKQTLHSLVGGDLTSKRKLFPGRTSFSVYSTLKGSTVYSSVTREGDKMLIDGFLRVGDRVYALGCSYDSSPGLFSRAPATDVFLVLSLIEELVSLTSSASPTEMDNPFIADELIVLE